ncbi:hypothetical protein DERP_000117 [Dermatophagoides pteronyssinus]|uniref:Uncharacterized protein n=1 Tax=Dermatophagoides pteronyssinus TaxID=6956 RepID=A0ABQ8IZ88_DERPT|nr:hypothetical protein DERP_000117 [Dermatophagoides pteronyssinus]
MRQKKSIRESLFVPFFICHNSCIFVFHNQQKSYSILQSTLCFTLLDHHHDMTVYHWFGLIFFLVYQNK